MDNDERPEWIRKIEYEAGEKKVVLAEGASDIRILSYFLEKVKSEWNVDTEIIAVDSKARVFKAIKIYHPEWIGIVARDEWTPEKMA